MKVKMILDNREHKLISLIPNTDVKNLDNGDVHFMLDDQLVLIVERKTISDLSSSVKDGRYREQKARLILKSRENIKIMYIIEDDKPKKYSSYNHNLKNSTILSCIVNTMVRDGLFVHTTRSVEDTAEFLNKLSSQLKKNGKHILENGKNSEEQKFDYINSLNQKKKENVNKNMCFINQLCQIPGVSAKIGELIANEYICMSDLVRCYETIKDPETMLRDLPINDKRNLGPCLSKRIYEYLYNIE